MWPCSMKTWTCGDPSRLDARVTSTESLVLCRKQRNGPSALGRLSDASSATWRKAPRWSRWRPSKRRAFSAKPPSRPSDNLSLGIGVAESSHSRNPGSVTVRLLPRFAARISVELLETLVRADRRSVSIAETWRRVGAEAERRGLARPSYERVRVLVHESRRFPRGPSTASVLLDVAFRLRPPEAVLDHISGVGVPELRR
jgi:hypothetical protein